MSLRAGNRRSNVFLNAKDRHRCLLELWLLWGMAGKDDQHLKLGLAQIVVALPLR